MSRVLASTVVCLLLFAWLLLLVAPTRAVFVRLGSGDSVSGAVQALTCVPNASSSYETMLLVLYGEVDEQFLSWMSIDKLKPPDDVPQQVAADDALMDGLLLGGTSDAGFASVVAFNSVSGSTVQFLFDSADFSLFTDGNATGTMLCSEASPCSVTPLSSVCGGGGGALGDVFVVRSEAFGTQLLNISVGGLQRVAVSSPTSAAVIFSASTIVGSSSSGDDCTIAYVDKSENGTLFINASSISVWGIGKSRQEKVSWTLNAPEACTTTTQPDAAPPLWLKGLPAGVAGGDVLAVYCGSSLLLVNGTTSEQLLALERDSSRNESIVDVVAMPTSSRNLTSAYLLVVGTLSMTLYEWNFTEPDQSGSGGTTSLQEVLHVEGAFRFLAWQSAEEEQQHDGGAATVSFACVVYSATQILAFSCVDGALLSAFPLFFPLASLASAKVTVRETANVSYLTANSEPLSCVYVVDQLSDGQATARPQGVVAWYHCANATFSQVVACNGSYFLSSDSFVNNLFEVDDTAVAQEEAILAPRVSGVALSDEWETVFYCTCSSNETGACSVNAVPIHNASATIWSRTLEHNCETALDVDTTNELVFVRGFMPDEADQTERITALTMRNGSVAFTLFPFNDTNCDFFEGRLAARSQFGKPLVLRSSGLILVSQNKYNCLWVVNMSSKSGSNATTAPWTNSSLAFPFINCLTDIAAPYGDKQAATLYTDEAESVVVFGGVVDGYSANRVDIVIGVSVADILKNTAANDDSKEEEILAPLWELDVSNLQAVNVFMGSVFYISTVLSPALTATSIVSGAKSSWTYSLPPLPADLREMTPAVFDYYGSVCVSLGYVYCFDSLGRVTLQTSTTDASQLVYWGTPTVSSASVMLFLSSSGPVYALSPKADHNWESNAKVLWYNFEGPCGSVVTQADAAFFVCKGNQDRNSHIYVVNVLDGAFVLASGPIVQSGSTLVVSRNTAVVGYVPFSGDRIVLMTLATQTVALAMDTPRYFCAKDAANFYSFGFGVSLNASFFGFAGGRIQLAANFSQEVATLAPVTYVTRRSIRGVFCDTMLDLGSSAVPIARVFQQVLGQSSDPLPTVQLFSGTDFFFLVNGAFNVAPWQCDLCQDSSNKSNASSCPATCSVNYVTGKQEMFVSQPPLISRFVKPLNASRYLPATTSQELVLNASLVQARHQWEMNHTFGVVSALQNCDAAVIDVVRPGTYCTSSAELTQLMVASWKVVNDPPLPSYYLTAFARVDNVSSGFWRLGTAQVPMPLLYEVQNGSKKSNTVLFKFFIDMLENVQNTEVLPHIGSIQSATYDGTNTIVVTSSALNGESEIRPFSTTSCGMKLCPKAQLADPALVATNMHSEVMDESMQTLIWSNAMSYSLWSSGFARLDQAISLPFFRTALERQPPSACYGGVNTSVRCAIDCIPDLVSCESVITHELREYVYSSLTTGNLEATIDFARYPTDVDFTCFTGNTTSLVAALQQFPQNPTVRVVCHSGRILFTIPSAYNVVLLNESNNAVSDYFGVLLRCSACSFFLATNVAPQPLALMFVGAVKSLISVILAYVVVQRCTGLMFSLKRRYAAALTMLANFRLGDVTKADFQDTIVNNFSPAILTEQNVTERLRRLLGHRPSLEFVEYFEWNLCDGQQWILREERPTEAQELNNYALVVTALQSVEQAYAPVTSEMYLREQEEDSDASDNSQWVLLDDHRGGGSGRKAYESTNLLVGLQKATRQQHSNSRMGSVNSFEQINAAASDQTRSEVQSTFAAESTLLDAADEFRLLRHKYPQFFEYVLLPSRTLDIRLIPLPVIIIANIVYCFLFWIFCVTRAANEHQLNIFDRYQVLYYQFLNSTAVGSLLVDSVVRVTLQRRALRTNPYIIVSAMFLCLPVLSHCLIGAVLYIWLIGPLIAIPVAAELQLRRLPYFRSSKHFHVAFMLRSTARIAIIFAVCAALSLSYNYAALFVYSGLQTDARKEATLPSLSYMSVIATDYNSRRFSCIFEIWMQDAGAFMQNFAAIIGLF